jgi:hypothetical protein
MGLAKKLADLHIYSVEYLALPVAAFDFEYGSFCCPFSILSGQPTSVESSYSDMGEFPAQKQNCNNDNAIMNSQMTTHAMIRQWQAFLDQSDFFDITEKAKE